MKKTLVQIISEAKNELQANDKQMARHLRLTEKQYKEITTGARVLPLPVRKTIVRRIERLYDICGLQSEKNSS